MDYNKSEQYALSVAFKAFELDFKADFINKYREINAKLWADLENGTISSKELRVKRFKLLFNKLNIDINPVLFSNKYLEALSQKTKR